MRRRGGPSWSSSRWDIKHRQKYIREHRSPRSCLRCFRASSPRSLFGLDGGPASRLRSVSRCAFERRFDPMRICLGSEATKDNQTFTASFQEWWALNQLVFMRAQRPADGRENLSKIDDCRGCALRFNLSSLARAFWSARAIPRVNPEGTCRSRLWPQANGSHISGTLDA